MYAGSVANMLKDLKYEVYSTGESIFMPILQEGPSILWKWPWPSSLYVLLLLLFKYAP